MSHITIHVGLSHASKAVHISIPMGHAVEFITQLKVEEGVIDRVDEVVAATLVTARTLVPSYVNVFGPLYSVGGLSCDRADFIIALDLILSTVEPVDLPDPDNWVEEED